MEYILEITEHELLELRKKERYVFFINDTDETNIRRKDKVYIGLKDSSGVYQIYGDCTLLDVFNFSKKEIDKIIELSKDSEQIKKLEKKTIGNKPLALELQTFPTEELLMSCLSKGFNTRAQRINEKTKAYDYLDYVSGLGYAKDAESVMKQELLWDKALLFDYMNLYTTPEPITNFCNIKKSRIKYNKARNYCQKTLNISCFKCEYVGYCLNDSLKSPRDCLNELKQQLTETARIENMPTQKKY